MTEKPVRVLVVEDNPEDFKILQVFFSKVKHPRYKLENAPSLSKALAELRRRAHDIYLVDFQMGSDSGIDFLREAIAAKCAAPIIFLTGYATPELDMKVMGLGAAAFFSKNKLNHDILERSVRYALEQKRGEEGLRRQEEFFRAMIENAQDVVMLIEANGKARYVSPSIESILGYTQQERIGKDFFSLAHPEDLGMARDFFAQSLKFPAQLFKSEFRIKHKDGTWRLIETTGKSHDFKSPDFKGVVLNYRDVTEYKKSQESRERLANIIECTNEGIVACDLKGIVTHWNKGAEKIYGYQESEILGKSVTILLPPDHQDENSRQIEMVKQGKAVHDLESVRQRKGGQLVKVSISFSPFKDLDGKVIGLSAIVRDISEQKKSIEQMARLASIVESSEDAIYSVSLEGVVLSWNPGAQRIYGFTPEEIGGRDIALIVPVDREGEFPGILKTVKKGKPVSNYITSHRTKEKAEVLLSLTVSPVKNALGQVTLASVIAHDITQSEKARAVKDMLESERDQLLAQLQLQIQRMPIACILSDQDFHFTYWNPAAEKMFGYSFSEVEGRIGLIVTEKDLPAHVETLREVAKSGGTENGIARENIRKDGKIILCEWYRTPIYDSEGHFAGLISMALDITEKRKAEDVQSQLVAILQQTTDAVIGADLDGRIFSWNRGAESMLGYCLEEIVGENTALLVPDDRKEEMEKVRELATREENVSNYETLMRKKSGDLVEVSVTVSPIKDAKGKTIGVSAISRDITERKKAEESFRKHEEQMRLAQKMDAIGRLAGGVAHDFNNLLSVVGGNAEFLLSSMEKDNPHREELEEIQKVVRRGAELTKQLLVFGQKQISQPQAVNLNELSAEMNKMLKRLIDAAIDLSIIQDKDLRPILTDPGQMQQVILNLVLNARDAMPRGGHLIIETRNIREDKLEGELKPTLPSGDYVRLNVTDTGTGMSEQIQKHVFEPFFTTKAGKGTGLGLASVYGIVTKWSGHIFLHSTPGMGTTFTLYFPALQAVEAVAAKPKQIALIPQGSETILLAEDEGPVRKVLVRTLEKYGYRVLEAQNGIEAVQKAWAYKDPIHLLLTDTVMPKMNGKELADELKKTRPKTKVLFVSGYPREVLSQQGILNSDIHLIQKPFELEDLAREIRKILDEK